MPRKVTQSKSCILQMLYALLIKNCNVLYLVDILFSKIVNQGADSMEQSSNATQRARLKVQHGTGANLVNFWSIRN